jgi:hypothetical protein
MASEYIGLIVGFQSRRVYSVYNPDDDAELDNPRLLLLTNENHEPVAMVKVLRTDYMSDLSPDHLANLVAAHDRGA